MSRQISGVIGGEKPIVILGVDRSGTSATAGLVHHWGAFGGDARGPGNGASDGQIGSYETTALEDIHDRIFDSVSSGFQSRGMDFIEIFDPHVIDSKLKELASNSELAAMASKLVQQMRQPDGSPWYWKDPILSLLLPFWMQFWGDAAYIITVRNPEDSARSWNKFVRSGGTREVVDPTTANVIRWQVYLLAILRNTQHARSKLFVSYENLVKNPKTECERIAGFINRYTGREYDDEVVSSMVSSVDGKMWRNRSSSDFTKSLYATTEQKTLFEYLKRRAVDEDLGFNADEFPMPFGWKSIIAYRFLCNELMANPPSNFVYRLFQRKHIESQLKVAGALSSEA